MSRSLIKSLALAGLALAGAAAFAADTAPDGRGDKTRQVHAARLSGESATAGQILFHGGPVMTNANGVNVYLIWYGNWAGNTATTIVPEFLNHLGGSPYYGINTTYHDAANVFVQNKVTLAGQTTDNYSHGTSLSDAAIAAIVKGAVMNHSLPKDQNALYFVLTSKDVNETSGFCSAYCGWHTHATVSGGDYKYSFVGDAARCISSCAIQSTSPNNNPGADGMLSVIAHELEETVTDPDLNAWFFSNGQENADACAWTFGTEYTAPNGTRANMNLNGHDYMIQRNWVQATAGRCDMHL
jgi:hypothetical protein